VLEQDRSPPPAALKKCVSKWLSVKIVVMPLAQTGNRTSSFTVEPATSIRHFFKRGRRRRPGPVPAHLLVLRATPRSYILILPAFGIVSEIIPTFAASRCSAIARMVFATCGSAS